MNEDPRGEVTYQVEDDIVRGTRQWSTDHNTSKTSVTNTILLGDPFNSRKQQQLHDFSRDHDETCKKNM
jgi:hypothetical protein